MMHFGMSSAREMYTSYRKAQAFMMRHARQSRAELQQMFQSDFWMDYREIIELVSNEWDTGDG
jgi:hypothetical protein